MRKLWEGKRERRKLLLEASIYQRQNKMTLYSFDWYLKKYYTEFIIHIQNQNIDLKFNYFNVLIHWGLKSVTSFHLYNTL